MTIKILHVFAPSLTSRFGGQSIWWKSIFKQWNTPDVVHYVLDCEKNQIITSIEAFNFEYSDMQQGTSKLGRIVWIIALFRNLMKYKCRYDILHVHVLWWGGLLIGPWAKWNAIPALYESVLLDSDTPRAILKEKFGKTKIQCLKLYKAIYAISEYLAEDYKKFDFSAGQIFTLMNCVNMEVFFPVKSIEEKMFIRQKLTLPLDAKILVFVGSVIERKGVDILIRAFIRARSKRSDLYLLIVGPKNKNENPSLDTNFVNDLLALINKNNLSECVAFTGLVRDSRKLAEIYRASDIFVFPSHLEGLGNVVLEAMASELPVVASQLPVLEKIIQHKNNGIFVPVGDVAALADSILSLSNNPTYVKKLGKAAKKYIADKHSFVSWQSQLILFYEGLV